MRAMELNRAAVASILRGYRDDLRGMGIDSTDVRLCVWQGGQWDIKSGDVGFDTEHSDYCGANEIRCDDDGKELEETARDLIAQVEDQRAMGGL